MSLFFRLGLMACVLCGISGCAGGGSGSGDPKSQILCQAGPDCDSKWARANEWAEKKSGLNLLSKSDAQIKTKEAPTRPYDSRLLVVTITKNATLRPGIYEIRFVGGCTSVLTCEPSVADSKASFATFISQSVN